MLLGNSCGYESDITSNTAMRPLIFFVYFFLDFLTSFIKRNMDNSTSYHIKSLQALNPDELIFFCQDYIFILMKVDNKINKCYM